MFSLVFISVIEQCVHSTENAPFCIIAQNFEKYLVSFLMWFFINGVKMCLFFFFFAGGF